MKAKEEQQLLRRRGQLGKLDLLILDELGYVPASKAGVELLFDVIATASEPIGTDLTGLTCDPARSIGAGSVN